MKCPYCFKADTRVLDSRETDDSDTIRRRRECLKCEKRFTTYERVEMVELSVIKKDGSIEQFNKHKILNGLLKACEKRPVKRETMERVCREIELTLRQKDKTEIPSRIIGELVVERLKDIDEVAYVRFASVYKKFKDVTQFAKEIEKLKGRKIILKA